MGPLRLNAEGEAGPTECRWQAVLRCWECRFPRWNSPTSGIQGRRSSTLAREYRGVSPGVVATGVERRAAETLRRALRWQEYGW